MRLSIRGRRVVNALRVVWVLTIAWYELGVFHSVVESCDWPLASANAKHVLLVADPQVLDHRSYPDRSPFLTFLSRVFTDLNLRKSLYFASRKSPDVVIFLGDMMDNGRFAMDDAEYDEYFQRFKNIFYLEPHVPVYYIPGNHDTGLGTSPTFSKKANERYISHFGSLNNVIDIAGHTIVLIDAPTLAEEDYERNDRGVPYEEWTPVPGGPVEFVNMFAREPHSKPVILFTHIPLARPEGSNCGPLRERGSIHRGVGHGYQNTLGKHASSFLLKSLRPSLVFSGDDHDYCEFVHDSSLNGQPVHVKEVTVKSISMAMGIHQPGFQLLSLVPPQADSTAPTFADKPCLLPDQLSIYLSTYVPLIFFSVGVLLVANLYRRRAFQRFVPAALALEDIVTSTSSSSFSQRLRLRAEPDGASLPLPNSSVSRQSQTKARPRNSFIRDFRDVAVYPLTLFVFITWLMFVDPSTDPER